MYTLLSGFFDATDSSSIVGRYKRSGFDAINDMACECFAKIVDIEEGNKPIPIFGKNKNTKIIDIEPDKVLSITIETKRSLD